jgi:hypothetical protein
VGEAMMERLVVQVAPGKFDVIAGHKLNDEPLSRAEAARLAHEPVRAAESGESSPTSGENSPPKPAAQSAPQGAPAIDLRATRADQAGGSCGFRIKGSPSW